jgi:hypothetical protein
MEREIHTVQIPPGGYYESIKNTMKVKIGRCIETFKKEKQYFLQLQAAVNLPC